MANEDSGSISVISVADNSVTTSGVIFGHPIALAISDDDSVLYVAEYDEGEVLAVSTGDFSDVIASYSVTLPNYLALSPDGQYLYVPSEDGAGGPILTVIAVG